MNVCYILQTHKNPEQIYRLVRTILRSSPNGFVLVAHDSSRKTLGNATLCELPGAYLLPIYEQPRRADFSLLSPYFAALDWLCDREKAFDWLVYLSGQDYPTQSLATYEALLERTEYEGFLRYWDVFSDESPWGKGRGWKRYRCQYARLPDGSERFLKPLAHWVFTSKNKRVRRLQFHLNFGPFVGLPARRTPFDEDFRCYGGSQWHTLSRSCALYLREFYRKHPKIVRYFKRTVVPDETFVQTVLVNSQRFRLCNDCQRYADTDKFPDGRARLLTRADWEILRDDRFFFARKFDITLDAEVLDWLDERIAAT